MVYSVITTPQFEKDVSFYLKKKRYMKIVIDINELVDELQKGNLVGDEIPRLRLPDQENVFKVRVANTSINAGKSNGFRVIYYVVKNDKEIYLLTVYSKKDNENISDKEIIGLIRLYCV